ncbi:MAG: hypothetical protein ACHQF0_10850 [Chitinophagales bacterium]
MKKKYLVIAIYFVYAALLFIVAVHYGYSEEHRVSKDLGGIGDSLRLYFRFTTISFLSSSTFLIIAYAIHNKRSFLFILLAPFLNVAVCVGVGLIMNFVLWITQLEEAVSIFQQIFMIATISTMVTMLWLLGDIFKNEKPNKNVLTT